MKIFPTFFLILTLWSQAYGVTFEVMNEDAPDTIKFSPTGMRGFIQPDGVDQSLESITNFRVRVVCGNCIGISTKGDRLVKELPFEKIKKVILPGKGKTSDPVPVYSIEGEEIKQSLPTAILTILMSWDFNYLTDTNTQKTFPFIIALPFGNKEVQGKNKITLKIKDIKRNDLPEFTKDSKFIEYDTPPLDFKLTLWGDDQFITSGVYKFVSYGKPTVYEEFKSEEKLDSKSEKVIDPKSEGEVS